MHGIIATKRRLEKDEMSIYHIHQFLFSYSNKISNLFVMQSTPSFLIVSDVVLFRMKKDDDSASNWRGRLNCETETGQAGKDYK